MRARRADPGFVRRWQLGKVVQRLPAGSGVIALPPADPVEPPAKRRRTPTPAPTPAPSTTTTTTTTTLSKAEQKKITEQYEKQEKEKVEQKKYRYYQHKLHITKADEAMKRYVVQCYVQGLCWVLMYYYQGVQDWGWFYPFHYAPCASDLINLHDYAGGQFELGAPFKPFEQLMAVFPPSSGHALLPSSS